MECHFNATIIDVDIVDSSGMDSIELLMAIDLTASDSESLLSTPSTTTSSEIIDDDDEEQDTDTDNINNEDDHLEPASDEEEEEEEEETEVIYTDDVSNSTGSSPRFDAVLSLAPQPADQLPTAMPPPPPLLTSARNPRLVPATATTAAAAAAAKGPPTPVIVTATPPPLVGPVRLQPEYEPGASGAAARSAAQYTDSLRRRTETLIQKRLRMQRESVQKATEIRQLTTRLSELNLRLADELAEQQRLVDAYDRIRDTAQRALGVLHVVRDAESTLAHTKDRLLAALTERDDQQRSTSRAQGGHKDDDDDKHLASQTHGAVLDDPFGLD